MTKHKETILSSGKTLIFQIVAITFWLCIPIGFLFSAVYRDKVFFGVMMAATYGLMSFGQIKKILKLRSVAFDNYNIYIKLDGGGTRNTFS